MSDKDTRNLLSSFDGHLNRRSLLQGLVAMGAGGTALMQFGEALAQATAEEVAQLTILSQPGIVPEILKDVTVPQFAKSYPKTSVVFEAASNAVAYPKMLAQRGNPVISGAMVNDLFAQRGLNDKMWDKFNPDFVPNAKNLPAGLTTPGGFGIPFHLSPWGIMYNPDKVEEPKSWTDLWDPKYKGRVSMWDAYYDAYIMAAVVTGKGPDVEAGIKAWEPHKANIGAWVNSPTAEEDLVSRGEVWLAPHWGSWTAMAKSQGKNVAFTIPKEGGVQWTGHMQVCTGFSPRVSELTQRYLNTWLSDECQLAWIERGFYSPASTKVQIPEAMKSNPAIMTAEDAVKKLVQPDFAKLAAAMPKLKGLIDRTLKS
ncbi:spermidine/putrescine ABC transporter substrate-binding protein [Azorhizobium oxalatiphilum]|uniref:Spermidine/putrescine ABC transporter substrate-binding protein n=1 Tax=Azorhizobium oxalatiphilum TaxID=980631 RepID=A0A917F717_9HYPH|nr:extracellular solute-binding protein [Azorhizobium oxalatiphilum]GGF50127.1 spermidine/putrescine ABC transporter substrate-binding protein [Azorhizobium oxalatiphilum]